MTGSLFKPLQSVNSPDIFLVKHQFFSCLSVIKGENYDFFYISQSLYEEACEMNN